MEAGPLLERWGTPVMAAGTPSEPKMEAQERLAREQEEEEVEEKQGQAEEAQRFGEVEGRGMMEQQGSEAGSFLVVLLVEGGMRGGTAEEGESVKERRMRRETAGQMEVQEFLVLGESLEGKLQGESTKIRVILRLKCKIPWRV